MLHAGSKWALNRILKIEKKGVNDIPRLFLHAKRTQQILQFNCYYSTINVENVLVCVKRTLIFMFLNFNVHFEALRIGIFEFRFHRLKGGVNENPMGPKNKGSKGAKEPKTGVNRADHPYYLLLWKRPPRDPTHYL